VTTPETAPLGAGTDLPPCAGCGACCYNVVELQAGVDHIPEALTVEHDGIRCMDQAGDGACVALDPRTRLCTIYERRPQICRDFQRGGDLCRRFVGISRERGRLPHTTGRI